MSDENLLTHTRKIFDDSAEDYDALMEKSLARYGKNVTYYTEYKIRLVSKKINRSLKTILDFGCGTGRSISFIRCYFPEARITGCDISEESLRIAEKNPANKGVSFINLSGLGNKKFDLILVAVVIHHISPAEREATLKLLYDHLAENGSIFIFEHNPMNPLTRKAVRECPLDKGIRLIKPNKFKHLIKNTNLSIAQKGYYFFFPEKLKSLAFLERFMFFIPMGGQYFIEMKKK